VRAVVGLECERTRWVADPEPGGEVTLAWEPRRRYDPAADGWFGGDHVLEPADAARTPRGRSTARACTSCT
jgi:hypothetical protein